VESPIKLFLRMSRPLFLLGAVIVYALGVGIADYLGVPIDWGLYLLGQAFVTALQLSAQYLNEYFDSPADALNPNRTPFSGGSGAVGPGKLSRNTVLLAAVTALTIVASLTVLLINRAPATPLLIVVLVLGFLGAFFYSVPPVRLVTSGYGELTTSFLVAFLVPGFAFLLQTGSFHRLLLVSALPLTALHLAMMLVFEFPDYATDLKFEKETLLVRIGWERGMVMNNLLILTAFLILGLAAILSVPAGIVLPAFLLLPFGLLQIWQMRVIAAGGKPNWTLMGLTGIILFAGVAYMLAFAFWVR
jgi:1,4-dihydroxy-2-naphthoate octaprenyltransferase